MAWGPSIPCLWTWTLRALDLKASGCEEVTNSRSLREEDPRERGTEGTWGAFRNAGEYWGVLGYLPLLDFSP